MADQPEAETEAPPRGQLKEKFEKCFYSPCNLCVLFNAPPTVLLIFGINEFVRLDQGKEDATIETALIFTIFGLVMLTFLWTGVAIRFYQYRKKQQYDAEPVYGEVYRRNPYFIPVYQQNSLHGNYTQEVLPLPDVTSLPEYSLNPPSYSEAASIGVIPTLPGYHGDTYNNTSGYYGNRDNNTPHPDEDLPTYREVIENLQPPSDPLSEPPSDSLSEPPSEPISEPLSEPPSYQQVAEDQPEHVVHRED